jgi:hypothetical protein
MNYTHLARDRAQEHVNEFHCFIKRRGNYDHLSECYLLKQDSIS